MKPIKFDKTFNFEQIAERVLHGEIKGFFMLRNKERISSSLLSRNNCPITGYDYPYMFTNGRTYTHMGMYQYGDKNSPLDIMSFQEIVN